MTRTASILLAMLLSAFVLRLGEAQSANLADGLAGIMRALEFTQDDVRRVGTGHVVSRSLSTRDGREVATAGIVRVNVPPEEFVRRLTDIVGFKKGRGGAANRHVLKLADRQRLGRADA